MIQIGKSLPGRSQSGNAVAGPGFTLLELLIAMALLTLVVSITMVAMRLASRSMAAGERKMESQERLRTVMAVLDAQIQSQLPLAYGETGNKANYFRGARASLRMMTGYSIWGGRQGPVIIDYRVESDGAGSQTLYAAEQTPGIEGKRETRLFTDASEIFFEYYEQEATDETGKWLEHWSDESAAPAGVRLQVRYGTKKLAFHFPVRARGELLLEPITPFSATGTTKK